MATKKKTKKKTKAKRAAKVPARKKAGKKKPTNGRRIGHDYERLIVNEWKARFQDREWAEGVRRTDQSHRAYLCDVHGVPGLWQECGKNSRALPKKKLEQAVEDLKRSSYADDLTPISVTREHRGEHTVAIRLSDFDYLLKVIAALKRRAPGRIVVQLGLHDFMDVYDLAEVDLAGTIPVQKESEAA